MNKPTSLLQKQRSSFRALAAKSGFTSDELEQRALVNFKTVYCDSGTAFRRMKTELSWAEYFGTPSQSGSNIKQVLDNATDFWDFLAAMETVVHWATRYYVANTAVTMHLDWEYLRTIAVRFSLPLPERDQNGFRLFLESIPTAYLFDNEFNAFLDWTDDTVPPAIYYNYLLVNTLSELSKITVLKMMSRSSPDEFSSRLHVPNALFDNEIARQMSFFLDGKLFSEPFLPSVAELPAKDYLTEFGLELCSLNFVAFHEYGHLLLGHAEKPHTPDLEFEADLFALEMLSRTGYPNCEHAITSVFAIINVLEMAYGSGASHPSSLERLTRLANISNIGFDFDHFEYSANFLCELFEGSCATRFGINLFQS